ncbi:hypothetical protein V6N11_063872 [Hibiscus sabdariffa]|uniref:EF-hand domain-containing protein n=1 Tax=Hibiscus sabdariffa TaxID=183260 RepID=A0ABR2PM79_9ROSI
MKKLQFTAAILLLILTISSGSGRSIKEELGLVSDGMDRTTESLLLEFRLPTTTTVTCEPTYGFLPCTTKLWGHLFLLVVYEYLLSLSKQFISGGSDLFFQMFGTGIFGASLFNVLGIFPQVILVLVNGVSSSEETAQTKGTISMAILAGSTIMMLTLIWGSVIAFGSYDLTNTGTSCSPNAKNKNNKPFSLTGYGVRTDAETKYSATIMLLSVLPFLILQLAEIPSSAAATRAMVLISLLSSFGLLVSYCSYQVFEPWIQNRRLEYLMRKYIERNLLGRLVSPNGRPDEREIKSVQSKSLCRLFHKIDKNNNSYISSTELRAFILGLRIDGIGLDEQDFENKIMEEFDTSGDSNIKETEFIRGISAWLNKANNDVNDRLHQAERRLFRIRAKGKNNQPWWNYIKAAFLVTLGTTATIMLSKPLVAALVGFSTSANVPSFLVSYVVVPLALHFRQGFKAVSSARQKTEKAASLTFSEIYGAVFMNNVMGLGSFLVPIYIRDTSWGVSAEVVVVLLICTIMGILATFRTKFQFWTCVLVYLLYPMSLLLLYVLTNILGWS